MAHKTEAGPIDLAGERGIPVQRRNDRHDVVAPVAIGGVRPVLRLPERHLRRAQVPPAQRIGVLRSDHEITSVRQRLGQKRRLPRAAEVAVREDDDRCRAAAGRTPDFDLASADCRRLAKGRCDSPPWRHQTGRHRYRECDHAGDAQGQSSHEHTRVKRKRGSLRAPASAEAFGLRISDARRWPARRLLPAAPSAADRHSGQARCKAPDRRHGR